MIVNLSPKPSGIGRQTAISFALEGCRSIAICDRNLEGLVETQKLMKDVSQDVHVLIQQVDMLKAEQIEQMVVTTVSNWGRLDYAVNAAGENFVSSHFPNRQACMVMGGFPKFVYLRLSTFFYHALYFYLLCFPDISNVSNVPVL
jgi:NAD(P)-dependent dehydrogenase (short-subunit alcohol dehydrogenase family)